MKVYITPSGRVFHKDENCAVVGAAGVTAIEAEDDTTVLNLNRRLITGCRRCYPGAVPHDRAVITISEAAQRMGISASQAKVRARNGQFPGAFKLGPDSKGSWWRVSVAALESFLEAPVSG